MSPAPPSALVLVAPSGTGKTTVAHALMAVSPRYRFSVSATTRRPRPSERHEVDYHFLDEPTFRSWIERQAFAEWAQVHGRLYGTPLVNFEAARAAGSTLVLDIDVQGALQIMDRVPDVLPVFLLPPSGDVLLQRLRGRGTETTEETRARLRTALEELRQARDFPLKVVNQDVTATVQALRALVEGEDGAPAVSDQQARIQEIQDRLREELDRMTGAGSPEGPSPDYT